MHSSKPSIKKHPIPSPAPRFVKIETENKELKSENQTLKRENDELQRKYLRAIEELSDTRQRLLNVHERLTVTEQVTAATQRRELLQEGFYENLPPDSVYEKLRFDPAQEHIYTALLPPMHTGCILVLSIIVDSSCEKSSL